MFQPVEDVLIPPGSGFLIPFSVFSGHRSTKTNPLSRMSFISLFLVACLSVLMEEEALLCFFAYIFIISVRLPPALRHTCTQQQQQRWASIWTAVLCQEAAKAHRQHAHTPSFPLPSLFRLVTVTGQTSAGDGERALGKARWITQSSSLAARLVLRRLEEDEEGAVSSRGSLGEQMTQTNGMFTVDLVAKVTALFCK